MRLTTSPHSCAECHEIWEPKPPGTLWVTQGILRDAFTFTLVLMCIRLMYIGKTKQSYYRPEQNLGVPGGGFFQISRLSAHDGGRAVSPTHRPPLPHRKYSWYSFLLEAESTPGS